ncbi:MAG: bifunctional adenosylcobinamide kinase/adenosylcobinamide-phosphate guanylyltransferase [Dialister invisus]
MKYRVILHQKRRPEDWKTFEILGEVSGKIGFVLMKADTVLFDCITMYVNNILMEHLANKDNETLGINDLTALQTLLEKDLELLFNIISQTDNKEIIFVSDELGWGIVPANAMSRVYRDLVDWQISMWPKAR